MEGKKINDYYVERFLGQGTYGQTYKVSKNDRTYAMKLFKNEHLIDDKDHKRVDREINALKTVNHPNVVKYVDSGEAVIGINTHKYLVMEYIEGNTLDKLIKKHKHLTVKQAQNIGLQVLSGLKAIHECNIYHRDLKPANIIITSLGEAIILDFGMAKLINASSLTTTGVTMGTYAYMSPEQLVDAKHIDYRSDLYSFGAILFHMLTGRLPLEFNSLSEAYHKIVKEAPPFASQFNPDIPNKLDNFIATLLEKETFARNYTIDEAYNLLENLDEKKIKLPKIDLSPKLLPRLLHNERTLIERFSSEYKLDGIVFPANFIPKYEAVYDYINNQGGHTIIDPVVYRLAYSKFSDTKSLVNLPYVIDRYNKEKPSDFKTVSACQKRAHKSLEWQLTKNPSVLLAPFHYLDSLKSEWLAVDFKIFNECRRYLSKNSILKRLYAGICIDIESVADKDSRKDLVNYFTKFNCDGYFIMLNIDLNSTIKSHYYAFATIIKMLSTKGKPIILSRINDFGIGLLGLGATAISSGIGYIESFDESILSVQNKGYNIKAKYYIPELLTSFSETVLKDIFDTDYGRQFLCTCPYCNKHSDINYLFNKSNQKYHYLYKKYEQISILRSLEPNKRLEWFLNKIKEADKHCRRLKKEGIKINYEHFNVWYDALYNASKVKFSFVG